MCEIFAVSSYCPITNLEHADSAYEWAFGELKGYEKMDFKNLDATSFNVRKEQFRSYLKSINFNDKNFKNELKSVILKSANDELKNGKNLDEFSWLVIKNGVASDLNWSEYVGYVGRIKGVPAFDSFTLSSGENELFGDEKIRAKHFTKFSS